MAEENTQQTSSIDSLIDKIERGQLVLPEFQRDFKWPAEKTSTLFDSINRNLFIGSLIISRPKFPLACKKFDMRERGSKAHKPKPKDYTVEQFETQDIYTLLDGQQRTTAIYRAIKGIDALYYCFQPIDVLSSEKFYNRDEEESLVSLEEYIEYVDLKPPKDNVLHIRVSDLYEYRDKREQKFLKDLVEPQLEDYNWSNEQVDVAKQFAATLFSDFKVQILKREKLVSVQLLDMPLAKFCLFFERSNSQGMNLSFVDIVNAKVYIKFKLSAKVAEAKRDYQYIDDKLVDPLVRYINYLNYGEVTKDSILNNITGDNFLSDWDECVKDIDFLQNWLETDRWLFQVAKMPYRTMLLPLLSFYQNLPNKDFSQASQEQMDQLKYWFYGSLLDNRYGGGGHGSTNVVIKKDCDALKALAKGTNISKDYWSRIRITSDFESYKRMDNAKSAGFMGLLYYMWSKQRFKNLENNNTISINSKVEVHHVFPENYVKGKFGEASDEYDFVDSVLNKVLINKIPNIKYSDKAPGDYLSDIKKQFNASLSNSLSSHGIDCAEELTNGGLDSRYLEFLKLRFSSIEVFLKEIIKAGNSLSKGKVKGIW